jgi:hypothetical protein
MRACRTALPRSETLSGGRVVRKAQHTWRLWMALLCGRVAGGICVATWARVGVRRQGGVVGFGDCMCSPFFVCDGQ